ncbi:MAG: hypothetical protein JST09_06340 [Bacteroidetes bacterium]|nr:hypothetical protein [Bacteroidota bacterium]
MKDSTIIQDELGHLHPVWWYCTVFPLLYMPRMKYTYRICTVSYKLNEEEINADDYFRPAVSLTADLDSTCTTLYATFTPRLVAGIARVSDPFGGTGLKRTLSVFKGWSFGFRICNSTTTLSRR